MLRPVSKFLLADNQLQKVLKVFLITAKQISLVPNILQW